VGLINTFFLTNPSDTRASSLVLGGEAISRVSERASELGRAFAHVDGSFRRSIHNPAHTDGI
jgi:hypothetical protein